MYWKISFVALALVSAIGLGLAGCDQSAPAPKAADEKAPVATPAAEKLGGLAELSEADRKAAEAQGVCPVSGERLGTMGKPFKVTVKGRDVFLCCDGCKDEFEKNPDKFFAKLDKKDK